MNHGLYLVSSFLISVLLHGVVIASACGVFSWRGSTIAGTELVDFEITIAALQSEEQAPPAIVKEPSHSVPHRIVHTAQKAKNVLPQQQPRETGDKSATNTSTPGAGSITLGNSTAAVPIFSPSPPYPSLARRSGFEGNVLIALTINTEGNVSATRLIRSSDREDCDKAALDAIRSWRFEPAKQNGIAVESEENILVRYELE